MSARLGSIIYAEDVSSDDQSDKADQPGETDDDAAWREIVENFGERIHLDDEQPTPPEPPAASYEDELDEDIVYVEDDERYEPPEPPPLPHTTPDRLLAWVGLLGTPLVVIALLVVNWVLHWSPPTWLIAALVIAFLGGFGYLIYTMSDEPHDPWDDGARV